MAKRIRIRNVRLPARVYNISRERKRPTRAIMLPDGRFAGRRNVRTFSQSDKTGVIRLVKDFDVNKDKKITSIDFRKGQIAGRLPMGFARKPSTITVRRHIRKGNLVSGYRRRVR